MANSQFDLPPPPSAERDFNDYVWRDWFTRIRNYLVSYGQFLWDQLNFTGSKLSDIQNRPHNVLQSIQGGNSNLGEYYHLSLSEYNSLASKQEEIQTATLGQTVFTLTTFSYTPGSKSLSVYVDGVNQIVGASESYLETNTTTITFTSGLHKNAKVKFKLG